MKKKLIIAAKRAVWSLSPALFRKIAKDQHPQTFSVAIYQGNSPFELNEAEQVQNPVISAINVTDAPAGFVADPFMLEQEGCWYMFFEVFDKILRRGRIGLATSNDGYSWSYSNIVIKEPFHMAYPQVFEYGGEIFLIPDTPGQGVRVYRALEFPHRWKFLTTVLDDATIVDPTVFRHGEGWWMLAGGLTAEEASMPLRLYTSPDVTGPWSEHPMSPIPATDERSSRPSGRIAKFDNRLFRFAQDGIPVYGSRVRAFEITELSPASYKECELSCSPILDAGSHHWNSGGMHHIDAHQLDEDRWLACVDGWFAT